MIAIKRIYEDYSKSDGYRILVDRLWPRGISKERAKIDLWSKETAPSDKLRKWYSHDPKKWDEFKKLYHAELSDKLNFLIHIKEIEREQKLVTLLYCSKNKEFTHAIILQNFLNQFQN